MKGKNKFIIALFAIMALVVSSVAFALNSTIEQVRYANAQSIEAFSAELEGGIIFSAERVYFAVDDEATDEVEGRHQQLIYQSSYNFKSIQTTNNTTEYFADYALRDQIGNDNTHKHVISDGDFVMVDDNATYTATLVGDSSKIVPIKQGIMITLGGYYYDSATGEYLLTTDNTGAGMNYAEAQAFLNGEPINDLPNSRGYNNSNYHDFTWFIVPGEDTEGHYQINFLYEVGGRALRYDFDFYLLLQSSYDQKVEVTTNGTTFEYDAKPTMNIPASSTNNYEFFGGTSLNYPTITFDYSRYDLEYTHISGDVQTTVKFDYDEANQALLLSSKVYNDETARAPYYIDTDKTNTIVTLMFVNHGKYTFKFNYIYKYQGEQITIPQSQIAFNDMTLNIYGYQLKYSKAGFASADMTYLEIYKNNTMFILVDGFQNANDETTGDNLGVQYKLTNKSNYPTGTVNSTSETASIIMAKDAVEDIVELEDSALGTFVNNVQYKKTDRGLWLTLHNEYYLENDTDGVQSYYYHNPNGPITSDYIKASTTDSYGNVTYTYRKKFDKVTTFTAPGYYLVQVKYDYDPSETGVMVTTQYFAFQITSTVPSLQLFKTKMEVVAGNLDDNSESFYAHEYTNQNVYAKWNDTGIFESTIVGKLYYSAGKYVSENTLKAVANGAYNSTITQIDYEPKDLIKNSGSYLLVLEVERSATKTYTYFTIDKEAISGLQVYEVVTNSIDNRAIYSIKQDAELNYITHTSKSVIDTIFTLDWADKNSGADITAKYYFTPFIKENQASDKKPVEIQQGSNTYKYLINQYTIGQTTNEIQIRKPSSLSSALDINNVLTDQGIYEFVLVDQAGNQLTYIVIVDRTEGMINATYGDANEEGVKNTYLDGQLVADYVELEWGTHKAINLRDVINERSSTYNQTISKLLTNQDIDNYYSESGNNLFNLRNMFQQVTLSNTTQNLFIVENLYTEIRIDSFDSNKSYYLITKNGTQQIKYPNGVTTTGWDETANNLFENATNRGIKVNVDKSDDHIYQFTMVGSNQVTSNSNTGFVVRITPDELLGQVYSSSQEGADYSTEVRRQASETEYFSADKSNENIKMEDYYLGQVSDDGVFVFEWAQPKEEDNVRVVEVKYNYYQLMGQAELNSISKKGLYYPYKYMSTNYILQTELLPNDVRIETVSQYKTGARTTQDGQTFNQSNPINLAYETYYETSANNELILTSKKVTQSGLYIITRVIEMKTDSGEASQPLEYSYAFFVDRNMIIGYSITDINQKIVGQFIHASMPNSQGEVYYDNFNKQGVQKLSQKVEGEEVKIYLETNKLPTKIQVPSGKYVSGSYNALGDVDTSEIIATSHQNLKLKLSVYFYDSYRILGNVYKGSTFKIMDNEISDKDGYINLKLASDNEGAFAYFKNARIHTNDNSLSLPGVYVFVVSDTVGKELNSFVVSDYNKFVFGIKLTNQAPTTDVYTYAEINGKQSDKVYAEDNMLHTNQEFVDFVIPVENLSSYKAQLDIATIQILRDGALWLGLKPSTSSTSGNGFDVDTSGKITSIYNSDLGKDYIEFVYDENDASKLVSYIIHLDTGLEVINNEIIDYEKEFVYTINIQYILANDSNKEYYQYISYNSNEKGIRQQFYATTYTVTIDRTPNSANLDALMQEQGKYFKDYHDWLAEQNNTQASNDINKNFAYRNTKTANDYYVLANELYYQFASQSGNLSNQAMYALSVDYNNAFNPDGLSAIYYRKLNFDSNIAANTRMGLLPISDWGTGEYFTFNETTYSFYSAQNNAYLDPNGNIYYWAIMNFAQDGNYIDSYNNSYGSFYEIVEKDMAGNYTQYVIYFAPIQSQTSDVTIAIKGTEIGEDAADSSILTFGNYTERNPSFIGIDYVEKVSGLIGFVTNDESGPRLPYYANINILNSARDVIKTIYTNSTSKHATFKNVEVDGKTAQQYDTLGIESEIYDAIKGQGNYIIEYVDVFGNKLSKTINNYTEKHNLNSAIFEVKQDYMGQYYVTFDELTSKVDNNTYWYVDEILISYNNKVEPVRFTTELLANGTIKLKGDDSNEIWKDQGELDRLNLKSGIQYLVTLIDVGNESYVVPISTAEGYYAYDLIYPDNVYIKDNVYYTANQMQLSYNSEFYTPQIEVWEMIGEDWVLNTFVNNEQSNYYNIQSQVGAYKLITLIPDTTTSPADSYGSARRFVINLQLNGSDDDSQSFDFDIYIDTRATDFAIENTNKVDKIDFVKSTLHNGANGVYEDYNEMDLRDSKYYNQLIAETINVSWTRLTSDYFTYTYELLEFENAHEKPKNLLEGSSDNQHPIKPKENTTGKYIFKVTIRGKDRTWIASRVYGIYMSTTITGLYEVKDGDGKIYDYSAITNLSEIGESYRGNETDMARELGFANVGEMNTVFDNFGRKTAIPMYIANTELTLHSNQDNGVSSMAYKPAGSSYAQLSFYRIYRSNYLTFAVVMEVYPTDRTQNILSTLSFTTSSTQDAESLLNNGTAKTIYNANAEYYKLTFNSYNRNTATNPLERHNKIIVDVYYRKQNQETNIIEYKLAKRIIGGTSTTTPIEFKNGGSYRLKISDMAGNVQYFSTGASYQDYFTVTVMKEMLYMVNGEAPIQYAYYDGPVTLQINRYNEDTGRDNYVINTIRLEARLNSQIYTKYEHPTESATYIFKDYGTYLITMRAKLLNSDEMVTSQLVFTILNPNEARSALDFTSIYGYNIKSVHHIIGNGIPARDVTSQFMDLLQDKSNTGEINVYNKLITYERLVEIFGTFTYGKMQFRVVYEVDNDDLLPARSAEFSFTLNNQTATINSSIKAGGKTTKPVTIKFNAANIYARVGECKLVINGEVVLRIDASSSDTTIERQLDHVGQYYIQLMGDSGNVIHSFNFTIKEPLNTVSIILIVVVSAIVIALVGTFIWLRTRMKVR